MSKEPQHKNFGDSMSEWIVRTPGSLNDIPVGLWQIVGGGRDGFGLEGDALIDFVRRSIHSLVDAGAMPVRGAGIPGVEKWLLQTQYGRSKREIAEAVIAEWLRDGAPTPEPWTGLWFGLPRSYLGKQSSSSAG